jgi:hypothetical protein
MSKTKLKKNLNIIEKINPNLYDWIKKEPDQPWIKGIKSADGSANLLISEGSRTIAAYGMKGAQREAYAAANKMKLYKENISIIIGFGLGYLAKAIIDKMEKGHRVVIIEPVGHIVRLALENFDFANEIDKRQLIITKSTTEEISATLGLLDSGLVVNDWLLTINKYTKLKFDEYSKSMKIVMDTLNQIMCSVGTIAGTAGAKIADNDIACLPYVIRHRGVSELSGLFKDKSAITVSTGPSLAKNIHQLISVSKEDRAIVIAVGQALRILLAYDIVPDFICTVDFGEVNMGHFKGLMDCGVPLVTINRAYAPLLRAWQGPKFIVATPVPGHEKTAAGILKNKGSLEAGGSVAHLCFAFAQLLGCNPITFIGQDLALGKTSHIPLADAAGEIKLSEDGQINWEVKDHRCSLHGEQKSYGMGPVHQVPGYYGRPVLTNLGLASFITSFEGMVNRCKSDVINATEGGADIKGTKKMMLKEVIEECCQQPIDKSRLEDLKTLADDGDKLITDVIPLLKQDIKNLDKIIKHGRRGLATGRGMRVLMKKDNYKGLLTKEKKKMLRELLAESVDRSEDERMGVNIIFYNRLISKLKKSKLKNISILAQKNYVASETTRIAATKNPLVSVAIYGASRRIWSRELKVKETFEHFLRNQKDALTRLERNALILNAAIESAKSLKPSYKKTLKLLKEYDKSKDDDLLIMKKKEAIDLSDSEEYFKADNWAHPLLDARRALKETETTIPCHSAKTVLSRALGMRTAAIKNAEDEEKRNWENKKKLITYNELITRSRKEGKENQNFEKALSLLEEATKLLPDKMEAKWGVATALHHSNQIPEAVKAYEKLLKEFPDNNRFKFEMGNVLLKNGDTMKGLTIIEEAMKATDEFDGFLSKVAQIYEHAGMKKSALKTYNSYLKKFPADYEVWNLKGVCLSNMKKNGLAIKAFKTCLRIKPDFEQARKNITMLKTKPQQSYQH